MTDSSPPGQRRIRSYVLREGRMTEGQRAAFARLWPRFGIDYDEALTLEPQRVFGNAFATYLEIGFGNGDALLQMARSHPQRNFLGIEVHRPGVGHLLLELERAELSNVRVLRQDATAILGHALPTACLDGVYLFFPDPWPKRKHHKRRIVQSGFVSELARVIRPGGFVHMATDWHDYARHMLSTLQACAAFENSSSDGAYAPRPPERALTRFEQRGQRMGHGVWDLLFRRRVGDNE